jgi:Arc/MetJ family transcription regulator
MRTNIVLDDNLVDEAFKFARDIHTKKELIEKALQEFVSARKRKDLRELKGKIQFDKNYNYKEMRAGK